MSSKVTRKKPIKMKTESNQKKYPLVSFVMVCCNGLEHTVKTIKSFRKHTIDHPWELIVIDNATNDGTTEYLKGQKDIVYIRSDELLCYGAGMNIGLAKAHPKSKYLSIMNNDLLFTPGYLVYLLNAFDEKIYKPMTRCEKVGIAGPMSNHVGGYQMDRLSVGRYTEETLDDFSIMRSQKCLNKTNEAPIIKLGFLSGFFWVMTRECYETVGNLHEFKPLGFEDNDYTWRAMKAGYACVMVTPSFIDHFGGATTERQLDQKYAKRGLINRFPYYEKWWNLDNTNRIDCKICNNTGLCKHPHYKGRIGNCPNCKGAGIPNLNSKEGEHLIKYKPKKLVAGYRVKNVGRWFKKVLAKMSEVADEIVIFNDHSTDDTEEIAKSFEKVVTFYNSEETTFHEARDRNKLLELCYERSPDWVIITDGDEVPEDNFTREVAERLMNPIIPQISAYVFRYVTLWDNENTQRIDGIFGSMANIRMFRHLPSNPTITMSHPQGLHCNSTPDFPPDMVNVVPYRILHYGNMEKEDRYRKYQWFEKTDTDKRELSIGAGNYRHLIHKNVQTIPVQQDISVSCCMIVKDEEEHIERFLDEYHSFFNEIVIVDTGSSDKTKDIIKFYSRYGNIKLFEYPWNKSFAYARNFAISKCTSEWIWIMDADEMLGEEPKSMIQMYYRLLEFPTISYTVTFLNFLPVEPGKNQQTAFPSQNVRIFRNHVGIKYDEDMPVHESVEKSVNEVYQNSDFEIPVRIEDKDLSLFHMGYLKPKPDVEDKLKKYEDMLLCALAINPKNAMAHFSLALHYEALEQNEKAEIHYKQAIEYEPRMIHSYREYANYLTRKAKKVLIDGTGYADPNSMFGRSLFDRVAMLNKIVPDVPKVGMPIGE